METYKYNGLRNFLLQNSEFERYKLNKKAVMHGIISLRNQFEDGPLLVIYEEKSDSAPDYMRTIGFPEGYKNCIFVAGKIRNLDITSLSIEGDDNKYSLEKIIDVIPREVVANIKHSENSILMEYFFGTEAFYGKVPEDGVGTYNIDHYDPANAFLQAKNNYTTYYRPLRLEGIRKAGPGRQRNTGRGVPKDMGY